MNKYSWLVTLASLVAMACGSSNSNSSCGPCATPDILIHISSNGALVKNMTVSGPACEHTQIRSPLGAADSVNVFEPDALEYDIDVNNVGECDIHLELENGRVLQNTFEITLPGGCCQKYTTAGNPWNLIAQGGDAG